MVHVVRLIGGVLSLIAAGFCMAALVSKHWAQASFDTDPKSSHILGLLNSDVCNKFTCIDGEWPEDGWKTAGVSALIPLVLAFIIYLVAAGTTIWISLKKEFKVRGSVVLTYLALSIAIVAVVLNCLSWILYAAKRPEATKDMYKLNSSFALAIVATIFGIIASIVTLLPIKSCFVSTV